MAQNPIAATIAVNSQNHQVQLEADAAGRLLASTVDAGTGFPDGAGTKAYTYNGDGTIATQVWTYNGVSKTKTYNYTAGRLTSESAWV